MLHGVHRRPPKCTPNTRSQHITRTAAHTRAPVTTRGDNRGSYSGAGRRPVPREYTCDMRQQTQQEPPSLQAGVQPPSTKILGAHAMGRPLGLLRTAHRSQTSSRCRCVHQRSLHAAVTVHQSHTGRQTNNMQSVSGQSTQLVTREGCSFKIWARACAQLATHWSTATKTRPHQSRDSQKGLAAQQQPPLLHNNGALPLVIQRAGARCKEPGTQLHRVGHTHSLITAARAVTRAAGADALPHHPTRQKHDDTRGDHQGHAWLRNKKRTRNGETQQQPRRQQGHNNGHKHIHARAAAAAHTAAG